MQRPPISMRFSFAQRNSNKFILHKRHKCSYPQGYWTISSGNAFKTSLVIPPQGRTSTRRFLHTTSNPSTISDGSGRFIELCNQSRTLFAKYCSEPMPMDRFVRARWIMCGAHAIIADPLQNIYQLADKIPKDQEQAFAFFVFCSTQSIDHHHHIEETYIFPNLEPEFMTAVLDEHAAFAKSLHDLENYAMAIMGVSKGKKYGLTTPDPGKAKEPYDGKKIKSLLESLAVPLFTHLQHEIDWLEPEKIRASGVPARRFEEIDDLIDQRVRHELDLPSCLVFSLFHSPPYNQAPDLPWILKKVIAPWVAYWKHRKSWRWFPDYSKQPFGPL